jgi:hypothetical protein
MQQQMDRPATAALEQGGGDALLGARRDHGHQRRR